MHGPLNAKLILFLFLKTSNKIEWNLSQKEPGHNGNVSFSEKSCSCEDLEFRGFEL